MTPSLSPLALRTLSIASLVMIIAAFALRNLPWHLDDFDQAKQAFVSYEMVEVGEWWFQHTPAGSIATKPPLAGWISAGLYFVMGKHGWEFAWRLPSFASALLLLAMLWSGGRALAGPGGALLAACAFGFNLLAPRLATLVRTDMLLTLLIFLAGWLILERIRRAEPWTSRHRWQLGFAVLAALLVKGPILYAFLLPGLVVHLALIRRGGLLSYAWAGWTPWVAPLLIFAAWLGVGIWLSRDFYEQVVLREFLGRFDMSDAPVHKHQPLWFYFVHVLHKWAPWSVALVALVCLRRVRERLRLEPALLWLGCWTLGGLIFMSLVPSKRVDRIFPIIPPLCLLLAALAEPWLAARQPRLRVALIAAAALMSTGYAIVRVALAFRDDARALVRFGQGAREQARGPRFAVVWSSDEGLLLYTGRTHFTPLADALRGWQSGELDQLVIREKDLHEHEAELQPYHRIREAPRPEDHKRSPYILIERAVDPAGI